MARRSPKLALRQSCVLDQIQNWSPGRFLEVGAGIGLMTRLFLDLGHWGQCYDPDARSREFLRSNLGEYGGRIEVIQTLSDIPADHFDYLLAFEVLEHIVDDVLALSAWTRLLRVGGKLILSVPAHQRKFGASDERVGHVRRYERDDLLTLLNYAGYRVEGVFNYGFPLTEISRRISNGLFETTGRQAQEDTEQRSLTSSYSRPRLANHALRVVGESAYRPFFRAAALVLWARLGGWLSCRGRAACAGDGFQ